ncbi:hypothetical protein QQF64_025815 [Cirrhinus molitorella]|uniref:Uncharacterized protein n=1 Tax=Cirrhinus molitorella TaxID=172907 RepID=A0ABR3NQI4_9TELE
MNLLRKNIKIASVLGQLREYSDPAETEVSKTALFRVIVIIVEFATFAAPTVILLQIICARRAGSSGVHYDHVFISSGQNVSLRLIVIIVGVSFAVLLPALILWLIWKKRAGVRRATEDSVEQTDDVTYTEVTVNKKNQAKNNKVHCDDKVAYASIRGAKAGAQED